MFLKGRSYVYSILINVQNINVYILFYSQGRGEGLGGLVKFLRGTFLEYFFKHQVTLGPVSDLSLSLADGRCTVRQGNVGCGR